MSRLSKNFFHSPTKQLKIWMDSPCTISFTNKLPYIERAGRFQYNSIYYRDDPFKPAKKIDQFQKPELLLTEFRRSVKQAQKRRGGNNRSHFLRSQFDSGDNQLQINLKEKQIVDRLCPKNQKQLRLEYDYYGNRSSFYAADNQKPVKKVKRSLMNFKKTDNLFTESLRIDMSRPENFNPGPGTYFSGQSNNSSIHKKSNSKTIEISNTDLSQESRHSQIKSHVSRFSQLKERPVLISKTIVN